MSEFKEEPVLILNTMDDVRNVLTHNRGEVCGFKGLDEYRIKSLWIIGLIDELATTEYPYNSTVKKLASERLGLPVGDYHTEGDTLSLLVYNAQCYRRSDQLYAKGYKPFTRPMLEEAFQNHQSIKLLSGTILKPKMIDGELLAMKPRVRKYHMAPIGQPAQLVTA